jgi:hypothetical protein
MQQCRQIHRQTAMFKLKRFQKCDHISALAAHKRRVSMLLDAATVTSTSVASKSASHAILHQDVKRI